MYHQFVQTFTVNLLKMFLKWLGIHGNLFLIARATRANVDEQEILVN